jgi:superfamily II DNA or RNA helicase
VGRLSASELQEAGHLANCHVNIVQLVDHVEYKDYQQELKYLTTNVDRIAHIAQLVDQIKESGNTLILVDRLECGKLLQTELSTMFSLLTDKPDVIFVSGNTKSKDRKDEYDEIATSTNKVIIATYGVAAVGINIPRIFNLVLFEPGKSFVRVIQSIGRGIRKAQDKDHVEIWDITSSCKFAKRHLTKRKQFYKEAQYPFSLEKLEWK